MRIKFCGADRTVTGSQHLLELNGNKILLDCGLYQGKREDAYNINKTFLYDPAELHAIVLSHAHIDHSGNLPSLSRKGFKGDIYATPATRDLCAIMLQDSAHIQQKDTEFVNKRKKRDHQPLFNPLYDFDDVRNIMKQFKTSSYSKQFNINGLGDAIKVTFFDAGHILGSAQVLLDIKEKGKSYKFAFSGDIGRPNLPILRDPDFMGNVNYIISESTYGGRVHGKADDMEAEFEIIMKDAIAQGGKILVPAFSVGRTQEVVFALSKLFARNAVPKIPIFVDSPLSTSVSDIFKIHHECFDDETSSLITKGVDVFGFSNLTYIRDVEESKRLNELKGSCMIISASGMCESGRILHHLANNIENPKTVIMIVGYNAPDTLGRRLVESKDKPGSVVKIFGDDYKVNAKIVVMDNFSAHADKNELADYFNKFDRKQMEGIFLVHGDYDQQQILQSSLKSQNFNNIQIPEKGFEIEV